MKEKEKEEEEEGRFYLDRDKQENVLKNIYNICFYHFFQIGMITSYRDASDKCIGVVLCQVSKTYS